MTKTVKIMCRAAVLSVVMVFLANPAWTTEQAVDGPSLVLLEEVFHFNEVKEGTVLKHTFRVINEGNKDLTIKRVKPG